MLSLPTILTHQCVVGSMGLQSWNQAAVCWLLFSLPPFMLLLANEPYGNNRIGLLGFDAGGRHVCCIKIRSAVCISSMLGPLNSQNKKSFSFPSEKKKSIFFNIFYFQPVTWPNIVGFFRETFQHVLTALRKLLVPTAMCRIRFSACNDKQVFPPWGTNICWKPNILCGGKCTQLTCHRLACTQAFNAVSTCPDAYVKSLVHMWRKKWKQLKIHCPL